MPSKKQEFAFPGLSAEQILLFAYGTFSELGWTPKYAGPNAIAGYTPRRWNKYDDEVMIEATDGAMTITSTIVHNESFDLMGRNKKHIQEFITAFERVKASVPQSSWAEEIEKLKQQTVETVNEQTKQAEEINKVMKLAGSNLYATYAIIAINLIVFILMAINGAGVFEANPDVHIKWGSNYTALTMSGEWWRLITNIFIHFGIIHLVMNTYALYMAGVYLEPMLGKTKYLAAYLCTGVIASIASLWWHKAGVNSAGASGAIFGLYGVFLALLFTNLIPKQVRVALLQSIGIFVLYNLFYGMKSGIDNAAHIGGLLSGMIIGFSFYLELSGKINVRKSFLSLLIVALTIIGTAYFLNNYKTDAVRVEKLLKEFFTLQDKALQSAKVTGTMSASEYKESLTSKTLPAWRTNLENLNEMETLNMTGTMQKYQQHLKKYVQLRIEQTDLLIKAQDAPPGTYTSELNEVENKIMEVLKEEKQ